VGLDKSIRHLWKEFRGLLRSGQRLSFPWLFMSQKGLFGMTNPFVTCESSLRGDFSEGSDSVFQTPYESKGAVWAYESIRHLWKEFRRLFWLGGKSVFFDCLCVNRGCGAWRMHSLPVKRVLKATSEWATTKFCLTVYESKGAVWADESIRHLWKQFQGRFLRGQRRSFSWLLMSQRGCVGWRIHTSPVNGVSGAIFDSAASQFSLTVYESTGADESIRHVWKEFRGLLLSGQRLSFPRLFLSHHGVFISLLFGCSLG